MGKKSPIHTLEIISDPTIGLYSFLAQVLGAAGSLASWKPGGGSQGGNRVDMFFSSKRNIKQRTAEINLLICIFP